MSVHLYLHDTQRNLFFVFKCAMERQVTVHVFYTMSDKPNFFIKLVTDTHLLGTSFIEVAEFKTAKLNKCSQSKSKHNSK